MILSKYPQDVNSHLVLLGERIRTARSRRRWSQQDLADRIGVERRSVARLEEGDGGVGIGIFFTALWVLGLWDTVNDIAAPELDKAGEFLEKQRQPRRIHSERMKDLDF
jgi:transcriptional regulator with XRE-family HTH domain